MMKKINLDEKEIKGLLPIRPEESYKGDFGRLLLIGGNERMGGAIQLATQAAVYTGAGLTTVLTSKVNLPSLHTIVPEAMVTPWENLIKDSQLFTQKDVILIGPGLGRDLKRWRQLRYLLNTFIGEKTIVLFDGDALTLMSQEIEEWKNFFRRHVVILTPHAGEWARLTHHHPNRDNLEFIFQWVKEVNVILVKKGHRSQIFTPNEDSYYENQAGNPSQATGGMGDTLAGMIAGLSGQIPSVLDSVKVGLYLHSKIADNLSKDHYIVLPHQIINELPKILKKYQ